MSAPNGKPVIALRRPPKGPTPAAVEAFVSGEADAVPPPPPKGRGLVQLADGRMLRRRMVYLPPELDKRLAVRCAVEDRKVSDVVAEALAKFLK